MNNYSSLQGNFFSLFTFQYSSFCYFRTSAQVIKQQATYLWWSDQKCNRAYKRKLYSFLLWNKEKNEKERHAHINVISTIVIMFGKSSKKSDTSHTHRQQWEWKWKLYERRGEITSTKYKQYKQQNVSNDNGDTRTYILLCMVDKL